MAGTIVAWILLAFIAFGLAGCPHYNVWQQELAGKAELVRAEQNRQIAVQEAQANLDSSKLLNQAAIEKAKGESQAEIERAKGAAESNKIIANSLKGNDAYLRYLWINKLNAEGQVINLRFNAMAQQWYLLLCFINKCPC